MKLRLGWPLGRLRLPARLQTLAFTWRRHLGWPAWSGLAGGPGRRNRRGDGPSARRGPPLAVRPWVPDRPVSGASVSGAPVDAWTRRRSAGSAGSRDDLDGQAPGRGEVEHRPGRVGGDQALPQLGHRHRC